ncbi:MAG TPA: hypothetical protein VL096_18135 [Pirellulaceae bacterium]|nr:hypothetical protein [Pirellulaceae bacterium]
MTLETTSLLPAGCRDINRLNRRDMLRAARTLMGKCGGLLRDFQMLPRGENATSSSNSHSDNGLRRKIFTEEILAICRRAEHGDFTRKTATIGKPPHFTQPANSTTRAAKVAQKSPKLL